MAPRYWLTKSEPESYSIRDLARDGRTHWEGVRNYQARIYLRQMEVGDQVLFYHSNAEPSGVAGLARIARASYPDGTALDPDSKYYDPGATDADPRWVMVDLEHLETWPRLLSLEELKSDPVLEGMEVTRKGSRLSVTPVSAPHFARVVARARADARASPAPKKAPTAKKAKAPAKKAKAPAKKAKAPAKKAKAPAKKSARPETAPTARALKAKPAARKASGRKKAPARTGKKVK